MSTESLPVKFQYSDGRQEIIDVHLDEKVESLCIKLQTSSLELNGQLLDKAVTIGSLGVGEDLVIRVGPTTPASSPNNMPSGSSPAPRKRLEVPFKYQGRLYDVEWYMDQPFGEIAEKLNGLRPVKSGVIVSDDDTPSSLGLDGEGFIFLVGRLKRTEPASGRREVDSREGTKALAAQLGSRIAAAASARASGGATAPVVVPATASPSLSAPTGTRALQSDDSVLRVRFRLPPVDRVVAYDWGRAERVASFKVRVLASVLGVHPGRIVLQHSERRLPDDALPAAFGLEPGHVITVQLLPMGSTDIPPEIVHVVCRLLSGVVVHVPCGYFDPVSRLKDALQPLCGIVSSMQRLVFQGQTVDDNDVLAGLALHHESVVHVVRKAVDISETYSDEKLRANCRYCHTAGAQFDVRILCHSCGGETVVITAGRIRKAEDCWQDLTKIRVMCYVCHQSRLDEGDEPTEIQELPNVGFLCTSERDGVPCPGRALLTSNVGGRRMQYVAEGAEDSGTFVKNLRRVLTDLFSYAHDDGILNAST